MIIGETVPLVPLAPNSGSRRNLDYPSYPEPLCTPPRPASATIVLHLNTSNIAILRRQLLPSRC
jgi:hypothetical protein